MKVELELSLGVLASSAPVRKTKASYNETSERKMNTLETYSSTSKKFVD
jgi:hypothetical protein